MLRVLGVATVTAACCTAFAPPSLVPAGSPQPHRCHQVSPLLVPSSSTESCDKPAMRHPIVRLLRHLQRGVRSRPALVADSVFAGSPAASPLRLGTSVPGVTVRALSAEELLERGDDSKLDCVSKLCTLGMFGEESLDGSSWVLRNFNVKYGEDCEKGRQSIMIVAETSDGTIVGCVGMELMLLYENGMASWPRSGPSRSHAILKKRPFVSDLVVEASFRGLGLGRVLLEACHEIVSSQWAQEVRAMSPAQRLDLDIDNVFLKVDVENVAAVNLYRRMGYREVGRAAENLMVPVSCSDVQEWPVLHIYMQREVRRWGRLHALNPLQPKPTRGGIGDGRPQHRKKAKHPWDL